MGYLTNSKRKSPEVYPTSRGVGTNNDFARNYATGPTDQTDVVSTGVGTQVPWEIIASGAPAGTAVPITPLSTGIVRISGVLSLKNTSNDPAAAGSVEVQVSINNVVLSSPVPIFTNTVGIGSGGNTTALEAVPFLIETTAIQTPVGVLADVRIHVTANADNLIVILSEGSSLDLQEVSAPTG